MNIYQILVPTDFSEYSQCAFNYAIQFAKKLNASLTLIHVEVILHSLQPEAIFGKSKIESSIRSTLEDMESQLQEMVDQAEKEGVQANFTVIQGKSAAQSLLDYVQKHPMDLVIMGTHGRTGIKHFLLGSIAEKMVRMSPIPVLTVHKSITDFRLKNILIPVDFSEYSYKALDYGEYLASQFQSEITLLHVVETLPYPTFYPEGFTPAMDFIPNLQQRIDESLQNLLKDSSVPVHRIIRTGTPSPEIVHFAQQTGQDLIILTTRGLTGLEHILIGSTTERVVRISETPVLTIPSKVGDPSSTQLNLSDSEENA
ncbi:MAG: universal stress protein [Calditrichaeota bacterium]|nr:MAG: universal stress protein [Calditrichota bacterium]